MRQYVNLLKLAAFCKNPNLTEPKQEQMRMECLFYWRIPDRQKISHSALTVDDLLAVAVYKPGEIVAELSCEIFGFILC